MNLLQRRLEVLFSPHRRWIGVDDRPPLRGGWLGSREVIVSRAACMYHRLAFPTVPAGERAAALQVAVRRLAPEPGARCAVTWDGGAAHVWFVDREAGAGIAEDERVLCESALLAKPEEPDHVRLVALSRGFEGQVWRSGVLAASRWWPSKPSDPAWSHFLRGASVGGGAAVPEPVQPSPGREPWGRPTRRLRWEPAQLERVFWRAVALGTAALLAWPLVATVVWSVAAASLESRLAGLRSQSAPLIDARERAEADRTRLEALASLRGVYSDAELQTDVRALLPAADRLTRWSRDGDSLRFEIAASAADPRPYVQAFAGHPLLGEMVVNPAEEGRLQFDVVLPARQPLP